MSKANLTIYKHNGMYFVSYDEIINHLHLSKQDKIQYLYYELIDKQNNGNYPFIDWLNCIDMFKPMLNNNGNNLNKYIINHETYQINSPYCPNNYKTTILLNGITQYININSVMLHILKYRELNKEHISFCNIELKHNIKTYKEFMTIQQIINKYESTLFYPYMSEANKQQMRGYISPHDIYVENKKININSLNINQYIENVYNHYSQQMVLYYLYENQNSHLNFFKSIFNVTLKNLIPNYDSIISNAITTINMDTTTLINELNSKINTIENQNTELKNKIRNLELEIYYLKSQITNKPINYDYDFIKNKYKKLNNEFKRFYKLSKFN